MSTASQPTELSRTLGWSPGDEIVMALSERKQANWLGWINRLLACKTAAERTVCAKSIMGERDAGVDPLRFSHERVSSGSGEADLLSKRHRIKLKARKAQKLSRTSSDRTLSGKLTKFKKKRVQDMTFVLPPADSDEEVDDSKPVTPLQDSQEPSLRGPLRPALRASRPRRDIRVRERAPLEKIPAMARRRSSVVRPNFDLLPKRQENEELAEAIEPIFTFVTLFQEFTQFQHKRAALFILLFVYLVSVALEHLHALTVWSLAGIITICFFGIFRIRLKPPEPGALDSERLIHQLKMRTAFVKQTYQTFVAVVNWERESTTLFAISSLTMIAFMGSIFRPWVVLTLLALTPFVLLLWNRAVGRVVKWRAKNLSEPSKLSKLADPDEVSLTDSRSLPETNTQEKKSPLAKSSLEATNPTRRRPALRDSPA